jgi:hypothetical protein
MIRFETKPQHHDREQHTCRRCRVAAREGALTVHVLALSEGLDEVYRSARASGCSAMISLALLAPLLTSGCASQGLPHRNPNESYDQANLKQNDSGCPTAVYITPNGVLEQCK